MRHVILDTNCIGLDAPLGGNAQRLLVDAAERGQLVLAIPELVVSEQGQDEIVQMVATRDDIGIRDGPSLELSLNAEAERYAGCDPGRPARLR